MTDTNTTAISIETIVDRISFVAWRTDWRTRYATASETIRDAKRELVRIRSDWKRNAPNPQPYSYEYQENSIIEDLPRLRRRANALMIERAAATDLRDAATGRTRTPSVEAIAA